jgi:hypothetical protein
MLGALPHRPIQSRVAETEPMPARVPTHAWPPRRVRGRPEVLELGSALPAARQQAPQPAAVVEVDGPPSHVDTIRDRRGPPPFRKTGGDRVRRPGLRGDEGSPGVHAQRGARASDLHRTSVTSGDRPGARIACDAGQLSIDGSRDGDVSSASPSASAPRGGALMPDPDHLPPPGPSVSPPRWHQRSSVAISSGCGRRCCSSTSRGSRWSGRPAR